LLVAALHAAIMVVASVEMLVDQIFSSTDKQLTTEGRCFRSPVGPLWRYLTELIMAVWGDDTDDFAASVVSVQRCMPDDSAVHTVSVIPDTAGSIAFWVLVCIGLWMSALVVAIVLFPFKRHAVHVDDGLPVQQKSMKVSSAATLALETARTAKSVKVIRQESQRRRQYVSRSPGRWLCVTIFAVIGIILLVLLFTVVRNDKPDELDIQMDSAPEPSCAGVTMDDHDFCNATCTEEAACEDMCQQRCNAHCLCNLGRTRCGLFCYRDDVSSQSGGRLLVSSELTEDFDSIALDRMLTDDSDMNTTTTTTTTFDMNLCFGEVCDECEECWSIPPCEVPAQTDGVLVGPDESGIVAFASVPAEYLAIAWCELDMWSPVLIGFLAYIVNAYACALVSGRAYTYATQVAEQRRQNILWRDLGRQALRAEKAERKAARALQTEISERAISERGGPTELGSAHHGDPDERPNSRGSDPDGIQAPPRRQGTGLSGNSQRSRVSSLDSSLESDVVPEKPRLWQKVMRQPHWVRKERPPAPIAVDEDGRVFKV